MTTSAAATAPTTSPTADSVGAKSPHTMAAEAIAAATRRLTARRGRGTDPSNAAATAGPGAAAFPNVGSESGGGAVGTGEGGRMGETVSGSKRDRTEYDTTETEGGGGLPLLAVASGSADTAATNNTASGKSNELSGCGGIQVRGGHASVLLGLAMASPNTLEGGIRGGIGMFGFPKRCDSIPSSSSVTSSRR